MPVTENYVKIYERMKDDKEYGPQVRAFYDRFAETFGLTTSTAFTSAKTVGLSDEELFAAQAELNKCFSLVHAEIDLKGLKLHALDEKISFGLFYASDAISLLPSDAIFCEAVARQRELGNGVNAVLALATNAENARTGFYSAQEERGTNLKIAICGPADFQNFDAMLNQIAQLFRAVTNFDRAFLPALVNLNRLIAVCNLYYMNQNEREYRAQQYFGDDWRDDQDPKLMSIHLERCMEQHERLRSAAYAYSSACGFYSELAASIGLTLKSRGASQSPQVAHAANHRPYRPPITVLTRAMQQSLGLRRADAKHETVVSNAAAASTANAVSTAAKASYKPI